MKSTSNHKFNLEMLSLMGIDSKMSELIKFVIDKNQLDVFDENEHFYYWIAKNERSLIDCLDFLKFCKNGELIFEVNGKDYNVATFEGLSEMIVESKEYNNFLNSFGKTSFHAWKQEFILRYSKKFKTLEFYNWYSCLERYRKRDRIFVKHSKTKVFKVNQKSFIYIYPNGFSPRYISNKNALYFSSAHNSQDKEYNKKLNRLLLNFHLNVNMYSTDEEFSSINPTICKLRNKVFSGCSNLEDVLKKVTNNNPVPKILLNKMDIGNLIMLYSIVDYEEVDKIIKFLYEYWDFLESSKNNLCTFEVILNYLFLNFGVVYTDKGEKKFKFKNQKDSFFHPFQPQNPNNHHAISAQEIRDYLTMSVDLGKKINLKIKSAKRLSQEHDRISRLVADSTVPKIKVSKEYPEIESAEGFVIERISDRQRLCLESRIQKHCVKTYYTLINSGKSCIYSFLDKVDDLRYTLEIKSLPLVNKKQLLILSQIKGKFNSEPDVSVMERVETVLLKNNIYSTRQTIPANLLSLIKKDNKPNNLLLEGDLPF